MSIRGNILDNFMTDLQLVLRWTRRLAPWSYLRQWESTTNPSEKQPGPMVCTMPMGQDEMKSQKALIRRPSCRVHLQGGHLRRTVSLSVPETPRQNKSSSPSYTQILWGLRVCFSRGSKGYHKGAWGRKWGGHGKRKFVHVFKWLLFM